MVQRYSNNGFCVADADGSYVKYEDYAELEAKYRFERETGYSIVSIALERDKMMRRLAKLVLSRPCSTETEELAKDAIALFDLSN